MLYSVVAYSEPYLFVSFLSYRPGFVHKYPVDIRGLIGHNATHPSFRPIYSVDFAPTSPSLFRFKSLAFLSIGSMLSFHPLINTPPVSLASLLIGSCLVQLMSVSYAFPSNCPIAEQRLASVNAHASVSAMELGRSCPKSPLTKLRISRNWAELK